MSADQGELAIPNQKSTFTELHFFVVLIISGWYVIVVCLNNGRGANDRKATSSDYDFNLSPGKATV